MDFRGSWDFPVTLRIWVMECMETLYVLHAVRMAYLGQASSPHGSHGVNCDSLVADVLGIGSGWKQSKQN